jgi:hypothetical protein
MVEIFDRDGQVVWATPIIPGMYFAARPSRDGTALLTLWDEDVITTDTAEICRLDWDGEQSSCLATPGATHDFVELPDGSYTYGKDEPGTWKDYTLLGNTLTNITLDGVETELWNAWDEITPVELQDWATHEGATPIDWTHFNGLWYDEPTEAYYLSFWMLSEVRKIPAATGQTEWIMGGENSEFLFNGSEFGPQHSPQLVDDGLLVFDNRFAADASRLVRYSLDEPGRSATQGTTIVHPEDVHTNAMGDAHLLPNGYYATTFGDAGDMYVFTPEGQTVWSMQPPPGVVTGQIYIYDDLYDLRPN